MSVVTRPRSDVTTITKRGVVQLTNDVVTRPRSDVTTIELECILSDFLSCNSS